MKEKSSISRTVIGTTNSPWYLTFFINQSLDNFKLFKLKSLKHFMTEKI